MKIVVNPTQDTYFSNQKTPFICIQTNINDIFTILTVFKGVPQNVKCKKTKIIGFTYEIKNLIMFLFVILTNSNDVHQITFKEIRVLCEKINLLK